MRVTGNTLRTLVGTLATILLLSVVSFAQTAQHHAAVVSQIKIKNFGQMDERFYRGAQPKEKDYKDLAALGIKTVIDLRDDPTDYEKQVVESLDMRYVNIPMVGKKYPKAEHVEQFLKLADDPATGKFYVHCAGGRHRTGAMGAVYRFTHYGWNFDQVYQEMKQYDFYTRFGHGDFKKFVEDYWQQVQANSNHTSTTGAASSM
jgi:protein tyrosine/serine phosphatase